MSGRLSLEDEHAPPPQDDGRRRIRGYVRQRVPRLDLLLALGFLVAGWVGVVLAGGDGAALLTALACLLPLLAGRWARGQALVQRALRDRTAWEERERSRDVAAAAEEELPRIVGDLQTAVAGGLREIVAVAHAPADHAYFARVSALARDALADVRRVLGVLRREGDPAPRAPHGDARALRRETDARAAAGPSLPTSGSSSRGRSVRPDPRAALGVLAVAGQVELALRAAPRDHPLAVLTGLLIVLPLAALPRAPLAAAAATLAAVALQSAALGTDAFAVCAALALMACSATIGARVPGRRGIAGLVLMAAGVGAHAAAFHPDATGIAVLAAALVPWTLGRTARTQRALTQALADRAADAEQTRLKDARDAVTAERTRVARELHDAVAHNLSVIAIQAGGAEGLVGRDPARVRAVADLITTVAREALTELDRLALPVGGGAPGLDRVDVLAQRAREAGPVEAEQRPVPASPTWASASC